MTAAQANRRTLRNTGAPDGMFRGTAVYTNNLELNLTGDAFGRVVGRIAHKGAQATVTGTDYSAAVSELREAVESALREGLGECFWHEVAGDYRWLFRREGSVMRTAILWSSGTLTGWEHKFWAECEAQEFENAMRVPQ